MRVSEIGEFGLIRRLAAEFGIEYPPLPGGRAAATGGLLVPLGDDALVGERRDGASVWTTDTMVAGVHFLPGRASWEDVGWKAMAVNVSDVGAMGGTPHLALVTLALPGDHCVEDAVALYRGLREAAETYGVTLGGGDIVRAPVFSITIALSGWADLSPTGAPLFMTRSAARVGDVVAVTGTLGDSAGGFRLLGEDASNASNAQTRLVAAHLRPRPPLAAGRMAVALGVRCGMDISDGLVQDLGHIARASGVGIRVDAGRVPVSAELSTLFEAQAIGLALSGGEDYELALVAPRVVMDALRPKIAVSLTEIGEVVHYDEPRVAVVDESGREIPVGAAGWDHFGPGRSA